MENPSKKFLTAEWKYLVMANYEVPPELLQKYVPKGTQLEYWQGKTLVSIVAFLFRDTRMMGIPVPFHQDFEEVNLRFYVTHKTGEEERQGVVFIKEAVSKVAVASIANLFFHESYSVLPMSHTLEKKEGKIFLEYLWECDDTPNYLRVVADADIEDLPKGSEEEYIAEHYWGYSAARDGATLEFKVEHPRWKMHRVVDYDFNCNVSTLFGEEFENILRQKPSSIFMAAGSQSSMSKAEKIEIN